MKRFIVADRFECNDMILLESLEYVQALEEALALHGKVILIKNEEDVSDLED